LPLSGNFLDLWFQFIHNKDILFWRCFYLKQRFFTSTLLALMIAALCLTTVGCTEPQSNNGTINEETYPLEIEELDLSGKPLEDLESLRQFPNLKQLDLRGTGISAAEYETVKSWFPEAAIAWDIPFQGSFYPMDTTELTVTSFSEEDMAALAYFTELKTVSATECPDYLQLHALRMQYPELQVDYTISVDGTQYPYDTTELVLPGEDGEALMDLLGCFTELKELELTAPLAPMEQIQALMDTYPDVSFSWKLELAGIPVDQTTETLDLTNIPMTVEQMDEVLPYLLNLTYVDMTDCGISNEEMDALNRRYEDIKIVWTVDIGNIMRVKTDEIWFMPGKWNYWVNTDDVYNLRYCTDMICVDIGHMRVDNCEWVRFMPKLKYLLLADTLISDISPIAGLEELVFLEIFLTDVTDYTPLLELPALEDLNIHYTYGDPEIIKQLTWVNNIWWRNIQLSEEDRQMLQEALPNTHFEFWCKASTGAGWRKLQNYYDHRDVMDIFYMD